VDFDCFTALREEGQLFTNPIAMTARASSKVVFQADLSSVREQGSDWEVSFGGRVRKANMPVAIEFSADGARFTSFGTVTLTEEDSPFRVKLGSTSSDKAWVRLGFPEPARSVQAFIDNLAIHAKLIPVEAGADAELPSGLAVVPAPQRCPPTSP
jgi:hypothetical protein